MYSWLKKSPSPYPSIRMKKILFSKCVFCFQVFADFWIPFSQLYFSILFVQGMLLLYWRIIFLDSTIHIKTINVMYGLKMH